MRIKPLMIALAISCTSSLGIDTAINQQVAAQTAAHNLGVLVTQAETVREVVYKATFRANNKDYWFVIIEVRDKDMPQGEGENKFYVARPNFSSPRLINIPGSRSGYLDKYWQDKNNPRSFYCVLRHGNGGNVPTDLVKIDLSNPSTPRVRKLRSYRS
jgi:hypothetical protein